MIVTQKLIGYLYRAFNRDPGATLALRLQYNGGMQWTVANGVLTTAVQGGTGQPLNVPLTGYTVTSLAVYLATQPGYSVPFVDTGSIGPLSALSLLDGTNDPSVSNGDHLYSYTSPIWAWCDSIASELHNAVVQIGQMLQQMVTTTASGEWLDELGSYYDVPRLSGELDSVYGPRIIASVGKPMGNNIAIEVAINAVTGGLVAQVVDVATPTPFTAINGNAQVGSSYGLFNVVYSVPLDGANTLGANTAQVSAIVETMRDAGTHIGSILINGVLADIYSTVIAETQTLNADISCLESASLSFAHYDGTYTYGGNLVATGAPTGLGYNNSNETLLLTRTVSGVPQAQEQI